MKINISGNFFGNSGYSRHLRSLASAMNDLGCDVRIDTQKPEQWERQVNDFELNALSKPFDPEATTLFIGQPPYWPILLAEKPKKFIGYLVWEGDKIPNYWMGYLTDERIDLILVPSEHTYNAVINTLSTNLHIKGECLTESDLNSIISKIKIIPEGYDPVKFYEDEAKIFYANTKLCFIANKGWSQGENDRGGIQFLIKAFSEEFKKDDNVELKIKLNTVYNLPNWNLNEEMKKLNLPDKKDRPLIYTMTNNLDDNGLRKFYNEGDVFVTTSMAEGFNLPALEAMGCGLPVLATNYGGHTDFITNDNGWFITKGEMGYYSKEIIYEEVQWFKPSIKNIRDVMRHIYEHQDEIIKKRINVLKDVNKLTWLESAKKIKLLL